jgi:hypothetical protein
MALDHITEQRLEVLMMRLVFVNFLTLITAADDMIERTGTVHARTSGHDGFSTQKFI